MKKSYYYLETFNFNRQKKKFIFRLFFEGKKNAKRKNFGRLQDLHQC
jgi:hypothetical protein